jgi:hypothetical protein
MASDELILKRATDHRAGREDYDVLNAGRVVGRIYETVRAGHDVAWFWSVFYRDWPSGATAHKGYAVDREAAMQAFAEAWRGE